MASALFLYGQFEEVLVYLNSIRSFFVHDDVFNYNYSQVIYGLISLFETAKILKKKNL